MIILQYAAFFCLPVKTSGLAFMNSLEQEVLARNFVKIGSGYYWTPYIIMIAAVICIPVFLIVTVVSYCKREA